MAKMMRLSSQKTARADSPYEKAGGLLLANDSSPLSKRTADPSTALGMTKGRVALLVGVMVVMTRDEKGESYPWRLLAD
jgi:hypothetical protein